MTIEQVTALITILISGVALFKAWRSAPADIAEKYQAIADKATDALDKANARADRYGERFSSLETRMQDVECENQELRETLEEWKQGIELLINQLKANNIIPAWSPSPTKPRRRDK